MLNGPLLKAIQRLQIVMHLMEYNHATNNHSFIIRLRIGRECETAGVVMDINKSTEGGEGVAVVIGRGIVMVTHVVALEGS